MILEHGDMFSVYANSDLWLFTTNAVVVKGRLVMGAGIAKEVRDRFPGIDRELGWLIGCLPKPYGVILTSNKLGAFQTKDDWRRPSTLELIEFSTNKLRQWCEDNPTRRVDLNYPGIGKGGLRQTDVAPIIERLPDSVHVWRL